MQRILDRAVLRRVHAQLRAERALTVEELETKAQFEALEAKKALKKALEAKETPEMASTRSEVGDEWLPWW